MKTLLALAVAAAVVLLAGLVAWKGFAVRPDITVVLFEAPSPLSVDESSISPLASVHASDLTLDRDLRFVADPFFLRRDGATYVFYELLYRSPKKGVIAVTRVADDGSVAHLGPVLEEDFHLSYPLVFEHAGEVWMVPESWQSSEVRLYRADAFPTGWTLHSVLVEGPWVDPTVLRHNDRWLLFATDRGDYGSLHLWEAGELTGPWARHPASPVVSGDPNRARPGGRFVQDGDQLWRVGQDVEPRYGIGVGLYEVLELTSSSYVESPTAALYLTASGGGWNEDGMHHLDLQRVGERWIGAADGHVDRLEWVATPFD